MVFVRKQTDLSKLFVVVQIIVCCCTFVDDLFRPPHPCCSGR